MSPASPMGITPPPTPDANSVAAALLRDLSLVQTSQQRMWGYKRAASAVLWLEEPIASLLQPDGTLRKIPHVGPASARVILDVLHTGGSSMVEHAVESSPKRAEVERRRGLRTGYLSRAQVVAILADSQFDDAVSIADYRGDLQMHSVWSDGGQTLDDIVEEARRREYAYAAVTDHSYGLRIANGLSMEDLARQHDEIDRVNTRCADAGAGAGASADASAGGRPFRLLKGIEANIRADGTLDMRADELSQLEIVVAAPHAALRSPADQTARMIAAVTMPGVHILGHPRGRMYGSRPGITADWRAVFAAAAESDVAIEIDGDFARQDIDYLLAADAVAAGCLFALDSDAHGPRDWRYVETAVAHARLAHVPTDRIINTWPLDALLEWAHARTVRS